MGAFLSLVIGIITFLLFVLYKKSRRSGNLPPGPPPLPFIGNLNLDPQNFVKLFQRFRSQYGDVFSLILGAKTVVVINGAETLREFFVKNADMTSERPDIFTVVEISKKSGIISSSGQLWKAQRTFALNKLREFGFGKRSIENKVLDEVEVVLACVEKENGGAFNIYNLLQVSISNITCSIIFGKRFDYEDKTFLGLLQCLDENIANPSIMGLATFLPFIRYIPGDPFRIQRAMGNVQKVQDYMKGLTAEHKHSYDGNDARDFLDAYLRKIDEDDGSHMFTEAQLIRVLGDLFVAGTETTTTTLRWFIVFCIRNPEIQDRMREEIKQVVGESRLPNLEHRKMLPYCEAVLLETLRRGNILPFSLPHGLKSNMTFRGFELPKDTVIFPNLASVLLDPTVFPNPEEFNPSRFLDEDGNLTGQEKIVPFSLGRRVCLGESLAKTELFLFATSLVQRFRFLPEENGVLPSDQSVVGITNAPRPFRFRAVSAV